MGGFTGIYSFRGESPDIDFPEINVFLKWKDVSLPELKLQAYSNAKFNDDRILISNDKYLIGLDGVVLNKQELIKKYAAKSWEDLILLLADSNDSFPNLLRGEFNGLIYDRIDKSFSLFNNHTNTKAFFYARINEDLLFSFDYISLCRLYSQKAKLELDIPSVEGYMENNYIFDEKTHFKNIYKSIAGELLTCKNSEISRKKYKDWNDFEINDNSPEENIGLFNEHFENAIRLQFEKDREYQYRHVCTLSGGLDSRVVVMKADKLDYKNKVHLCTNQSNYLDEKIAKEIAQFLDEKLSIHHLDEVSHLQNYDTLISLNGGLVAYNGSSHLLEMLDKIYPEYGGILHSGQIGDGVFDSFPSLDQNFAQSDKYRNAEVFKLYNKAFNYVNNGSWCSEKHTYLCSPFMNPELLSFVLTIPQEQRRKSNLYLHWMEKYLPDALRFNWEKINMKPSVFNQELGMILNKFRIGLMNKIMGHNLGRSMNPYGYWEKSNDHLIELLKNTKNDLGSIAERDIELRFLKDHWNEKKLQSKLNILTLIHLFRKLNFTK